MWFAALDDIRGEPWFMNFLGRLLQGSPSVLRLMKQTHFRNPLRATFGPDFLNTILPMRWRKEQTGAWWKREEQGLYCPPVSLRGED